MICSNAAPLRGKCGETELPDHASGALSHESSMIVPRKAMLRV